MVITPPACWKNLHPPAQFHLTFRQSAAARANGLKLGVLGGLEHQRYMAGASAQVKSETGNPHSLSDSPRLFATVAVCRQLPRKGQSSLVAFRNAVEGKQQPLGAPKPVLLGNLKRIKVAGVFVICAHRARWRKVAGICLITDPPVEAVVASIVGIENTSSQCRSRICMTVGWMDPVAHAGNTNGISAGRSAQTERQPRCAVRLPATASLASDPLFSARAFGRVLRIIRAE
jgi:hypothetical protein